MLKLLEFSLSHLGKKCLKRKAATVWGAQLYWLAA